MEVGICTIPIIIITLCERHLYDDFLGVKATDRYALNCYEIAIPLGGLPCVSLPGPPSELNQ